MRFPAVGPHHSSLHNPSFIPINTTLATSASNLSCSFEPTSVLDLRHSPSPVHDPHFQTSTTTISDVLSQTEDLSLLPSINEQDLNHQHQTSSQNNLVDWDSIMHDLGLHDDFSSKLPPNNNHPHPPHHSPSHSSITHFHEPLFSQPDLLQFNDYNKNTNGFDYVEELIRAAGCFDSGDLQVAHILLSRLKPPSHKPLTRAAFYFKEALSSLLNSIHTNPNQIQNPNSSKTLELVESIKSHKAFSSLSPIPLFSDFSSNQSTLDSVKATSSSTFLHVIDFDIGFGGKHASLIRSIADQSTTDTTKLTRVSIRITAVVNNEFEKDANLVREGLCQLAHDLQIRFRIDFVDDHSLDLINLSGEETTVVHQTPAALRRADAGLKFLTEMRMVCQNAVVLVTSEEWGGGGETASFRRSIVDGLEFYSVLLESLDAAQLSGPSGMNGPGLGGGEWVRRVETGVLRKRIVSEVERMGVKTASWREVLSGAGMRVVGVSRMAELQANCLVTKGKVGGGGWSVGTRCGELVLSWQGRPFVATSVWKF